MHNKVISWDLFKSIDWSNFPFESKKVATNGCFELLHLGHIDYLQKAKGLGDILVVGINSDKGLEEYKSCIRVPYKEDYRAKMLAALWAVDYVTIFPGKSAEEFLRIIKPDIYVKGGDYSLGKLNKDEKSILDECGAEIKFIPFLEGYSTTKLIEGLKRLD